MNDFGGAGSPRRPGLQIRIARTSSAKILSENPNGRNFPFAATALVSLAAIFFFAACSHVAPPRSREADSNASPSPASREPLAPSPRVIVGRVLTIDAAQKFAFVDLAPGAPSAASAENAELTTRTLDLRETGRLRASRYVRGRTLGATIVAGQPSPGDEVVWLAAR